MTARSFVRSPRLPAFALLLAAFAPWTSGLAADPETTAAIRRALGFLYSQQLQEPLNEIVGGRRVIDLPGNWPQYFRLQGATAGAVRDVSPFVVAFIHHSLTEIVAENRVALGVTIEDLVATRLMRRRAVRFLRLFEARSGDPDAGTYGFWLYDAYPFQPGPILTGSLMGWLGGPVLGGERSPLNLSIFPEPLAVPSDADVTATTYAVFLDDAGIDFGPGTNVAFEQFFSDWRDLGVIPRRLNPPWLPPLSGAFLTWLSYGEPGSRVYPNDVDLVVNANMLYALARSGRLATPGVDDAVALIDTAVALGLHRTSFDDIAEYYPDNLAFQYAVSRAFREGVSGLGPAVDILADDLLASAIERQDGTAYWDRGAPQLNTAFAILTLLNAGRDIPLLDRAAAYLIAEQGPFGGFPESTFFIAPTDNGPVFEFFSASFTTAIVLEALARYGLAR